MLDWLIDIQRRLGESDRLFAQRLGIVEGTWRAVRTQRRTLSLGIIRAALREFPDLQKLQARHIFPADTPAPRDLAEAVS